MAKKKKTAPIKGVAAYQPTDEQRAKKTEEAIALLNRIVCVRIAPSPIHGVGVFAMRDIKEGEAVELDAIPHAFDVPYERFGELQPHVSELILSHWPQVVNGSHFLYPVTKMSAFLNHSESPNVDAAGCRALRAIKAGEELTEDYRLIANWEKSFPFLAGGRA